MSARFSDFIVFADESGSPVLENPDPTFPLFVLACIVARKDSYATQVIPSLQALKFDFVGHDQLILHERDIRRQQKDFAFLRPDPALRERFLERINRIVADADVRCAAAVIDKVRLASRYANPWSPYEVALHFCMEILLAHLVELGQSGRLVHVVFESRGAREDKELELHFRRIANNQVHWGHRRPDFSQIQWEPVFAHKRSNSSGLQLADLMARPLGLRTLRPAQPNRAFEYIRPKLVANGLKIFP